MRHRQRPVIAQSQRTRIHLVNIDDGIDEGRAIRGRELAAQEKRAVDVHDHALAARSIHHAGVETITDAPAQYVEQMPRAAVVTGQGTAGFLGLEKNQIHARRGQIADCAASVAS